MHRTLRRRTFGFLLLYLVFFLQAFIGKWFPIGLVRPEPDLLVLGLYALQGPLVYATLLGFWNGLLRDSLTHGPLGGWAASLVLFAWWFSLLVRGKRTRRVKKTLIFFGGILLSHSFLFLLRERGAREGGLYGRLLLQAFLPSACLTSLIFFLGVQSFQRWLSGSRSIETNG